MKGQYKETQINMAQHLFSQQRLQVRNSARLGPVPAKVFNTTRDHEEHKIERLLQES